FDDRKSVAIITSFGWRSSQRAQEAHGSPETKLVDIERRLCFAQCLLDEDTLDELSHAVQVGQRDGINLPGIRRWVAAVVGQGHACVEQLVVRVVQGDLVFLPSLTGPYGEAKG